jgi:hypothetical protein
MKLCLPLFSNIFDYNSIVMQNLLKTPLIHCKTLNISPIFRIYLKNKKQLSKITTVAINCDKNE